MRRREPRPTRVRWDVAAWLAVWLGVAAAVVIPHMIAFTQLSPTDEYQHLDYLDKAQRLEVVKGGEKVDELAMREQACRGIELPDYTPPPCDAAVLTPDEFPGAGYNYTYGDPPGYYAVTGPLAAVVERVPGVDGLVTAGRSIGILWLGGGLALTFLLALRLGADRWSAAGSALVLASAPVVVHSSATITTDAPLLLVGSLLCLVAVEVATGRISPWWLLPAAAVTTLMKATTLTVIGAVAVFLLLALRRQRVRGPWLTPVAGMVAAAAVPMLVWTLVTKSLETPAVDDIPQFHQFAADSIGWYQIGNSILAFSSPLSLGQAAFVPGFLYSSTTVLLLASVVNLLLVVGVAATAWLGARGTLAVKLALGTLISALVSGPALSVLVLISLQISYVIPGRYGLSLVGPAAAVVAYAASTRRFGGLALVALGVAGLTAFLFQAF